VYADLRHLHQGAQLGVLCQMDFFHMAFAIRPSVDTVDAYTTPLCGGVCGQDASGLSPWCSAA
jgi:hypothetical protein